MLLIDCSEGWTGCVYVCGGVGLLGLSAFCFCLLGYLLGQVYEFRKSGDLDDGE